MLSAEDYQKLTDPESVALVGVTSRSGKGSNNPLEVMLEWGYQGKIYPINPKGGEILGHTAYTSLLETPEIPDIAVICAPRDAVPELFDQCCLKKVKLVIIVAQGFFDGDAKGRAMQVELLEKAAAHGVRIVGPNTLGVVNNFNRFCTSFMRFMNPLAATGVLCQSGVLVVGAPQLTTGIGLLIDTGNTTDLEFSDVLGHMARDPRLKVLNLHIESLRNGRAFMAAAREAVQHKPVIVYKTGASPAGAVYASSHTGSLAGEYKIFAQAFKQCRLLQAQDVEELNDLNKVFTTFAGIKGNRIGVISISGGAGIMVVDACAKYGMQLAQLSPRTKERIEGLFPPWSGCKNPVDMWPAGMFHGYHNAYQQILETFMEDPEIDALLCITGSFLDKEGDFLDAAPMLREIAAKYPEKPLVTWTYGQRFQDYAQELEKDGNILYFYSIERAIRALAALYQYHHKIKGVTPPPAIAAATPKPAQAVALLAGEKSGNLAQSEVFKLLAAYDIPLARWAKAANLTEAAAAAQEIGYPVALKILSRDISHKTDGGGVRLDLRDRRELEEAYAAMVSSITQKHPEASLEGVIVQEYLPNRAELLIGCKRDPQFGPVLVFGSGGVFTEIMDDIALRIPPVSREELEEMIGETKIGKIIAGARGFQPVDLTELIELLSKFSRLVQENPAIAEMEINPLVAVENRLVALDARLSLK